MYCGFSQLRTHRPIEEYMAAHVHYMCVYVFQCVVTLAFQRPTATAITTAQQYLSCVHPIHPLGKAEMVQKGWQDGELC